MSIKRAVATVCLSALAWFCIGCATETKIGAVISRSGQMASYGEMIAKGIDLALEEVNEAGGYQDKPIEIVYRDDHSDTVQGREAVEDLIRNEGIRIIIGAVSSEVTLEIAKICNEREVVLLSPSASSPAVSRAGDYIFRNYPSDIIEGTAMADFAKGLGLKQIAIFAVADEFGRGLSDVFRRQFESRTRKVVKTFEISKGVESFEAEVEQLRELKPQGIYIIAYVNEMAELLREIHDAKIPAVIMGSGAVTEALPELAGEAVENVVYAQPSLDIDSDNPTIRSFVESFRGKYDMPPNIYAAQGYDSLKILVAALEEGGMAHPDSVKLGLLNIKHEGVAGRSQFNEHGDITRYPTLFVFSGGQRMTYEAFAEQGGKLKIPPLAIN